MSGPPVARGDSTEIGGQKLTESTGWIHVLPTRHAGGDGWVPSPLPSQGCTCISSAPSFCVSLKSGGKQPSWIRAWSVKLPDVPSLSAVPQSSVRIQNTVQVPRPGVATMSPRAAGFWTVSEAKATCLLFVRGAGGSELYTSAQALGLLFQN